jgi:hypothetical protein
MVGSFQQIEFSINQNLLLNQTYESIELIFQNEKIVTILSV